MTSYMFSIAPYIFIPCFTFWTNDSCTETHRYILFSVRSTPEFTPDFSEVRVTRSLVLCVCFVDRCLSFFFWPLCCLSFIDLRILIPPLVSSNSCYCLYYNLSRYIPNTTLVAPCISFQSTEIRSHSFIVAS